MRKRLPRNNWKIIPLRVIPSAVPPPAATLRRTFPCHSPNSRGGNRGGKIVGDLAPPCWRGPKKLCIVADFVGLVAQSVEQRIENPCVGGSIPPQATKRIIGVAVAISRSQKSPAAALGFLHRVRVGLVAQSVEQRIENPCVGGSIPPQATKNSSIEPRLGGAFCVWRCPSFLRRLSYHRILTLS